MKKDANAVTNTLRPILRWAGSKRKLLPVLLKCVPPTMCRYVEPFAGSACLFLTLQPKQALLSDSNAQLVETYNALSSTPEVIGRLVRQMPKSSAFYYRLRSTDPKDLDLEGRAARFIYLNRFCFNGVYRTNRAGHFNVPRGQKTGSLPHIKDFVAVGGVLRNASIFACDFEQTLDKVQEGDFVYLDPPYHKRLKGGYGEYGYDCFGLIDLPRLCAAVQRTSKRGATILISYSDTISVDSLLPGWHVKRITAHRHVSGFSGFRGNVEELLISNKGFNW